MPVKQQGMLQKTAATSPAKKDHTVKSYLKAYSGEIGKALPSQIGADRFNRICMSALTSNPALANCTPKSFIGAVLNSAQLGLEPNTPLGEAYLIPYKNHGVDEVQFQIGYKGMIQLARRSGEIALIKAQTVYEKDEFEYELGLDPKLKHVPAKGDRGRPVAYYAFYKTKDGDFDFEVDYRENIEKFARERSKSFGNKAMPWQQFFDEMAKKTMLKRVLKYAPMSTEISRKLATDSTIKSFDETSEISADMALVPDETEYIEAEVTEVTEEHPVSEES